MTTETPSDIQDIEKLVEELERSVRDEETAVSGTRLLAAKYLKEDRAALMSAISRVVQERKELEDRVAALVKCIDQDTESMAKDEARIAVLKKALRKYGWHNDDCPVLAICQHDNFKDSITCDHDKRCTCGYSAALAEVGQMEGKP